MGAEVAETPILCAPGKFHTTHSPASTRQTSIFASQITPTTSETRRFLLTIFVVRRMNSSSGFSLPGRLIDIILFKCVSLSNRRRSRLPAGAEFADIQLESFSIRDRALVSLIRLVGNFLQDNLAGSEIDDVTCIG